MNARKVATAVCLATLMTATSFSSVTPFPQTTITAEAASSTISIAQAGKKIAKATKKAYENKETVSVTVRLKMTKTFGTTNAMDDLYDAITDIELGMKSYHGMYGNRSSIYSFSSISSGVKQTGEGCTLIPTLSGKILTLTYKINGKNKEFRSEYEDVICEKKLVKEIQELTEGMNQYDKAWTVANWLSGRMNADDDRSKVSTTPKALWEHDAQGPCQELSEMCCKYLWYAGVKNFALVTSKKEDHAWNAVKIDGKIWYLDVQDRAPSRCGDYKFITENIYSDDELYRTAAEARLEKYNMTYEEFVSIPDIDIPLYTEDEYRENFISAPNAKDWKYEWNKSSPY